MFTFGLNEFVIAKEIDKKTDFKMFENYMLRKLKMKQQDFSEFICNSSLKGQFFLQKRKVNKPDIFKLFLLAFKGYKVALSQN